MTTSTHRDAVTRLPAPLAIGLGELAGLLLAGAAALTLGPEVAARLAASVLLGDQALDEDVPLGTALTLATVAHVGLAGLFGWLYGAFHRTMVPASRGRLDAQALAGLLFGLALWFVDVQLVARAAYPWFLDAPQLRLVVVHALFFGLPLGLLSAAASRARAARLGPEQPPRTRPAPSSALSHRRDTFGA